MIRVRGLRPAMLRAVCARCGHAACVLRPARAHCPRCGVTLTVSDGRQTVFHAGRVAAMLAVRYEYHRARRAAYGLAVHGGAQAGTTVPALSLAGAMLARLG